MDKNLDVLTQQVFKIIDTYYDQPQAEAIARMIEAYSSGASSEQLIQIAHRFIKGAY